jgi:hypothetical protein
MHRVVVFVCCLYFFVTACFLCMTCHLQDQRLLQRLSSLQALFFQQQGDWVDLLLEALQQQQQQQQLMSARSNAHSTAAAGCAAECATLLSPIAAQLLLESAVQQSCLAGVADAERMSVQVRSMFQLLKAKSSFSCDHN